MTGKFKRVFQTHNHITSPDLTTIACAHQCTMDAFARVKKAPELSKSGKAIVAKARQRLHGRVQQAQTPSARFTPYSTTSRIHQPDPTPAIDARENTGSSLGLDTPNTLHTLVGCEDTWSLTSAPPLGPAPPEHSDRTPPSASKVQRASSTDSARPVRRKDVLNMKHSSNLIVHSMAPHKSRKYCLPVTPLIYGLTFFTRTHYFLLIGTPDRSRWEWKWCVHSGVCCESGRTGIREHAWLCRLWILDAQTTVSGSSHLCEWLYFWNQSI